jgi:hypothetical protein
VRALIPFVVTIGCVAGAAVDVRRAQSAGKSSNLVTLRGCVEGRVLTTTDDSGLGDGRHTFDLTGDKQMRALLKEHSGHIEEVTGVLKAGDGNAATMIKEKDVGIERLSAKADRLRFRLKVGVRLEAA